MTKQEKTVKRRENDLEEARPELVKIEAEMTHASKKLKGAEKSKKDVETDLEKAEAKLGLLNQDLAAVQKAEERHQGEFVLTWFV